MYFGLLLDKSTVWVDESEKRVTAIFLLPVWPLEPPERSFFALFWPVLSPYCTSTVRNAFYKDSGCAKSKSWPGSTIEKPEVHSKMPEVVRNAVKFIFIRKMREKSRCRQTGSSGLLWPTYGQIGIRGR